MTSMDASNGLREATLEVVVTRADGSVEDFGTVAYFHENPLRRWAWRLVNYRRLARQAREG